MPVRCRDTRFGAPAPARARVHTVWGLCRFGEDDGLCDAGSRIVAARSWLEDVTSTGLGGRVQQASNHPRIALPSRKFAWSAHRAGAERRSSTALGGGSRHLLLRLTFVAITFAALIGGSARSAEAQTRVAVEAGASESFIPGRDVVVVVTLAPERLFTGTVGATLRERSGGSTAGDVRVDIEVAGSSQKRVVLTVATPSAESLRNSYGPPGTTRSSTGTSGTTSSPVSVTVDVQVTDRDGTKVGGESVTFVERSTRQVAGVMAKLAGQTRPPSEIDLGQPFGGVELYLVEPLLLSAGGRSLDQFSAIVGLPADLEGLTPAERSTLMEWVSQGGRLIIDTTEPSVNGLPDAWQPGVGGWKLAGAGEVRTSGGAATAGDWPAALRSSATQREISASTNTPGASSSSSSGGPGGPGGSGSGFNGSDSNGFGGSSNGSFTPGLSIAAGFTYPDITVLVAVFGIYVVIAGPVVFMVLAKRGQRTLVWVVVPAVAVVFSTGLFIAGSGNRRNATASHTTLVEYGAGSAVASTNLLFGSVAGEQATLSLPAGWVSEGADNEEYSYNYGSRRSSAMAAPPALTPGDPVRVAIELGPGEFQLVRARGPVASAPPLSVDVQATGRKLSGVVRNTSDRKVRNVRVIVANSAVALPDIDPGGSAPVSLEVPEASLTISGLATDIPEVAGWNPGVSSGDSYYSSSSRGGTPPARTYDPSHVNLPLWNDYLRRNDPSLRLSQQVAVVGWFDGLPTPIEFDGRGPIDKGITAVVVRTNPRVGGSTSLLGARLETVGLTPTGANGSGGSGSSPRPTSPTTRPPTSGTTAPPPSTQPRSNVPLFRLVLPPTIDGAPLDPTRVTIVVPASTASVLVGDTWLRMAATTEMRGSLRLTLTPEVVDHGVVLLAMEQFQTGVQWDLVLDDDRGMIVAPPPSGDSNLGNGDPNTAEGGAG